MEEKIRLLAYYKWEAAGCPICDGKEFWELAQLEIYLSENDKEDFFEDDFWPNLKCESETDNF